MNTIQFFISPIAGSVIGYFTNWLAIKMLFRPYTEKRILGMKLPFTPGLIPKEKNKLAKKVGETIGAHLLSEEVLLKTLNDRKIIKNIENMLDNIFSNLRKNDENLNDILTKILGNNKENQINCLEDKISEFIINKIDNKEVLEDISLFVISQIKMALDKKIEDINIENILTSDFIKDNLIKNYLSNIKKENYNLSQVLSPKLIYEIKKIIKDQFINYIPIIIDYLEKPFIEEKIKKIVLNIIEDNVGKLALMFVNEDKIYKKIVKYIKNYLENERQEIINYIYYFIDDILKKPIVELTDSIEKFTDNIITSENIENIRNKFIEYIKNKDLKILNIIQKFRPSAFYDIQKYIEDYLEKLIKSKEVFNIIKRFISKEIDFLLSLPISQLMKEVDVSLEENLKKELIKYYKDFIAKQSSNIIKAIDIPDIVEKRIKEFEMDYTEKIILSVVDKELKAITLLGAVLGFIIGLVPVIFNFQ
ncbi:DUF445 family protein [Defluviitalea phaphyphila]|uniref:DUF445 family protein n=1 Tax=Defluviitalea phaphyphila TaxID=1473580 RepID=UPI000730039D|nr:DUF445 family protein [Defluviitalea phaphyphila]